MPRPLRPARCHLCRYVDDGPCSISSTSCSGHDRRTRLTRTLYLHMPLPQTCPTDSRSIAPRFVVALPALTLIYGPEHHPRACAFTPTSAFPGYRASGPISFRCPAYLHPTGCALGLRQYTLPLLSLSSRIVSYRLPRLQHGPFAPVSLAPSHLLSAHCVRERWRCILSQGSMAS
jgi:hypothetical protein